MTRTDANTLKTPSALALALVGAALILAGGPATASSSDERDLNCLALNVYHESRNQPLEGQLAVAHVTLNRLDDPSFPSTICDVVFRSRHFSWTNDPAKRSETPRETAAWETARRVAQIALADRDGDPVQGSTYFHLAAVSPDWAASLQRVRQIGDHIFYARADLRGSRRVAAKRDDEQRVEVVTD
jgi:N-acetylmuramoyl-L-alanine amidase